MIDTKLPVKIYDDRNKCDVCAVMTKILYEDESICLCEIDFFEEINPIILFDKTNGEILTSNFEFWYAENQKEKL